MPNVSSLFFSFTGGLATGVMLTANILTHHQWQKLKPLEMTLYKKNNETLINDLHK